MKTGVDIGFETVFNEAKFATSTDGTQIAYYKFGSGPEVMFWQHQGLSTLQLLVLVEV